MLVIMTSVMTFFIGFIETLSMPMILAFSSSAVLGTLETVMASGMLVSSVIIGMLHIQKISYACLQCRFFAQESVSPSSDCVRILC